MTDAITLPVRVKAVMLTSSLRPRPLPPSTLKAEQKSELLQLTPPNKLKFEVEYTQEKKDVVVYKPSSGMSENFHILISTSIPTLRQGFAPPQPVNHPGKSRQNLSRD